MRLLLLNTLKRRLFLLNTLKRRLFLLNTLKRGLFLLNTLKRGLCQPKGGKKAGLWTLCLLDAVLTNHKATALGL